MPRDNAKCRKWEQERRIRLKQKFIELAKVLPSYDPTKHLCHINILEEARKAIEELQEDLKTFLNENKDRVKTVQDEIIKKLQKKIKKLLTRNEELNNLLKHVSKPISKAKHLKIPPELEKKMQQQEMEKENSFKWLHNKKKKKITSSTSVASKHTKKNSKSKNLSQNNNGSSNCLLLIPPNNTVTPNTTPALNQPFYLIANSPTNKNIKPPNIDLGLQQTPLITRSISCFNPPTPTLGPGTIVFSNGSILPVLPQSPMLIQPPRAIISVQKNAFGISLPTVTTPKISTNAEKLNNNITTQKNTNKATNLESNQRKLQLITPLKKCVTNTTHINKVPIPAISTNYTQVLNNVPMSNMARVQIKKLEKVPKLSRGALVMIHNRSIASKRKLNQAESETATKKRKMDTHTSEKTSEINEKKSTINAASMAKENSSNTIIASVVNDTQQAVSAVLNSAQVDKEKKLLKTTNCADITNDDDPKHEITNPQLIKNVLSSQNNTTNVLTTSSNKIVDNDLKNIELNLSHSELSNEIFSSLQVPSGCQNPDSTSPTAAFLLSFPLVSSFKANDVADEPNNENQNVSQNIPIRDTSKSNTTQIVSDVSQSVYSGSSSSTIDIYLDKTKKNNTIVESERTNNSLTKNNNDSPKYTNTEDNLIKKTHSSNREKCKSENNHEKSNTKETSDINTTQEKDPVVTSQDIKLGEITKEKTMLILDHVILSNEPSKNSQKKEISISPELTNKSNENINIDQPVFKKEELQDNTLIENIVSSNNEIQDVGNDPPKHDNNKQNIFGSLKSLKGMRQEMSQCGKDEINIAGKLVSINNLSEIPNDKESGSKSSINQEKHMSIRQKMEVFSCKSLSLPEKEQHELNIHKNIGLITKNTVETKDQNAKLSVSNDRSKNELLHKPHVKQPDFSSDKNILSRIDNYSCQKLNHCIQKQSYTVENVINNQIGTSIQFQNQQNNILWDSDIILNPNTQKLSGNTLGKNLLISNFAEVKDVNKIQSTQLLSRKQDILIEQNSATNNNKSLSENIKEPKHNNIMDTTINKVIQSDTLSNMEKTQNNVLWNPEFNLQTSNQKLPSSIKNLETSISAEPNNVPNKNQNNSVENVVNDQADISFKSDKVHNILLWNSELNLNTCDKQLPFDNKDDHNLWISKCVTSSEKPNQILHEHIRPRDTFRDMEMVAESKSQSVLGVVKQQNTLITPNSNAQINIQSNITRDTMLWNLDLNTAMDTSEIPIIVHHNKGPNFNVSNIKQSGNTHKNYKFNETEICLLYPQPSSENIGLLGSEKAKTQELHHLDSIQNSYIWNPESIITHVTKKQIDQTKTDHILWNRDSVEAVDTERTGNLSKKEENTFWNPELHKNLVNVPGDHSQNQTNEKQEIYLWNSKSTTPQVSVNHMSNFVVQNTDNNLWKNDSMSSATTKGQGFIHAKIQNTDLWQLEAVVPTDVNKSSTAFPNDEKNGPKNQNNSYSDNPQNTVCWKSGSSAELEIYKSQNKKQEIYLVNRQSIVAPVSVQNKLALQSCAKENQIFWNSDSLLAFDFHNKQSTSSWNRQLGESKNYHSTSQSSKKSGNSLWNPESIIATEPEKKNSPQLDKKHGSHLWNPESVVAVDVYKSQLTSIANTEKPCKNFWYPDSSIAPDHYKVQNMHTCSRYKYQPTSQKPIQSISNMHCTTACSKHKDGSISNSVFQNSSNNNENVWTPSQYSGSNENQVFNNSKINDYNVAYTWAPDLNRTNSQRKTNENAIDNVPNSGNIKLNMDQNLHYNTQHFFQNSTLWPINQFEKTSTLVSNQFKKPKKTTGNNIKSSSNAGNVQNDFTANYDLISESNNTNNSNCPSNDTKKNIWNMPQLQEVNNFDYNILQNSRTAKNVVVEHTEKHNSLQGSLNIFNQTNIQNMWNVKDIQPIGHDQLYTEPEKINQSTDKLQNNIGKPLGGTGMKFSLKERLNNHENRDASYNLYKIKNTSSNTNTTDTKSLIFEQNAELENKHSFSVSKIQNTTTCNIFKDENISGSKPLVGYEKANISNNNLHLYLEPTIRNSKTAQSSISSYNTHMDKNKSSLTNPNKMVHTPTSVNSLQNVNQVTTDNITRESDQKSQYYFSNMYPTVSTNINVQNEVPKNNSTSIYTNFSKDYSTPFYTSSVNVNYNVADTTFNENSYKNKPESKYGPAYYNTINDPSSKYYSTSNNSSVKLSSNKGKNLASIKPVTPENKMQTDYFLPTCSNQSYSHSSCITTTTSAISTVQPDDRRQIDSLTEDKQFYWSSSKCTNFVEPTANFVSPTLPTLVGDLALGNSGFGDQKSYKEVKKKNSSDNQVSFLSVSQLVDQNKTETIPAKMVSRRNSSCRSRTNNSAKTKRSTKKDTVVEKATHKSISSTQCVDIAGNFNEQFYDKTRNSSKNVSSSYSAEALIGNPICSSESKKIPETLGKVQGNNFLSENIISCFSTVDESNQNFQTPNFSHVSLQNVSYNSTNCIYTAASTIASTYLSNTFEPTLPDYTSDNINLGVNINKDKSPTNKHVKSLKEDKNHFTKKNKKKQTFDGFDCPFLPVPGSNNSPISPEEFHVHTNMLPSTAALYSSKNNVYQKVAGDFNPNPLLALGLPRNTIPQPEISPINSGSTFTNFNLSSIFPEINKGTIF